MTDAPLFQSISAHAWNADQTLVAFSPNNNEVLIYKTNKSEDTSKWERVAQLTEHSGAVSCIDWCPQTNQIVTCGHDRNAYVWSEEKGDWKPTLVILRLNRAATWAKWSPLGNKFAVASGDKLVAICHYEPSNNWWVSKHIKKPHKSTVTSVAWCINNKFVITGSTDMKARIFSAWLKNLDSKEDDGFGEVFPKQHEFGECLAEFDQASAWVHAVAWAPGAYRLAFAGHGSSIHFVQIFSGSAPVVQTILTNHLPYLDLQFLSDNSLVAVGFDMNPVIYEVKGESGGLPDWQFKEFVDKKQAKAAAAPSSNAGFGAARAMFSDAAQKGTAFGQKTEESSIQTRHKNVIVNVCPVPSSSVITKFSTAGLDGRICQWDVSSLGLK